MLENISYYFIGLWLGDGFISLNMGKYWKFGIVCSEFNYQEIYDIVKPTRQRSYQTKDGKYKYYELFTGNKELTKFLRENYGTNSKDKRIVRGLNSIEFWELFSGLMDSDGTVDKDSVNFLNTNKDLIDGISEYLTSYGIEYSINIRKSKEDRWSDVYVLRIKSSSLYKTDLHLRVDYKREAYLKLKDRAKVYITITEKEFRDNIEYLKEVLSRSTFYFYSKGLREKRVKLDIFNNMKTNR